MPIPRVLCVAEKPAIAKAVAQHLSGGSMQTVSDRWLETTGLIEGTYTEIDIDIYTRQ
jgi:DNA topoisomerase IA